jgi:hypothetical protein
MTVRRTLEQELGVSLFHRHARGLILTEQGELLHHTAHDVFMQLEAARAKLTDSRERPNGDLVVLRRQPENRVPASVGEDGEDGASIPRWHERGALAHLPS